MMTRVDGKKLAMVALLGIAFFLGACMGGGGGGSESATETCSDCANAVYSISFTTYEKGSDSGFLNEAYAVDTPTLFAIRSQEDLAQFWSKHVSLCDPQPPAPTVDFTTEMLVVVIDAIEPTTGYMLSIQAIDETTEQVIVEVEKSSPSSDTIVGDALNVPYHIVRLARIDKEFVLSLIGE